MAKVLSSLRITQHYGHNGHTGVDLGATSDRKVFAIFPPVIVASLQFNFPFLSTLNFVLDIAILSPVKFIVLPFKSPIKYIV